MRQAALFARSLYKAKVGGKGVFHKISSVYFTSSNIRTLSFSALPEKAFDNIDLFLLACDDNDVRNEYKSSDYVSELWRRGVGRDKIFIVPPVMYQAELPLLDGDELSPLCRNMNEVKPLLRYMEYHVTDFCNLKCKGCFHMANYVNELEFPGVESFRLSLVKLSEKFRNISLMRLMGGEPILCKNLHDYINTAHEIFPYSQIKIVTNGLLYKNMTKETIEAIKNAGAEIQVTQYPPTREIAGEIVAFCEQHGMKLRISEPVREFAKYVVSGNSADYRKCWLSCFRGIFGNIHCHFLNGTKFYPCPPIWTADEPKLKEALMKRGIENDECISDIVKGNVSASECCKYSYDLSQGISDDGWDILTKIESPMEICAKCRDKIVFFKWESELPQYNE
ncbi:MAG: radical SAM protein [Synergistaceae bacterium]|nr:radical SAM protein [Synergistaceae bacterium]